MQQRSSNSAGATYLDRESRSRAIEAMAVRAADLIPEIRRVILFGSMETGIPTPRSDADLLVEVTRSTTDDPRDRAAAVMQAMQPLACPVDVFVYTSRELEQLAEAGSPLIRTALENGRDLLRSSARESAS